MVAVVIILCTCAVTFLSIHMSLFPQLKKSCQDVFPSGSQTASGANHHDKFIFEITTKKGNLYNDESSSEFVSCKCLSDVGEGFKRLFLYENIICSDVFALIKFLFIVMSILSSLGALDGCVYLVLLWILRYKDICVDSQVYEDTDEKHQSHSTL